MAWLTPVLLLVAAWISHAAAICVEVLPPSPTCVGEDARFGCCPNGAPSIGWKINGTNLPHPHYPANKSRNDSTLCETLTITVELEYNMSEVQCVAVPLQSEPMNCEPVYLVVITLGTCGGDSSLPPTLEPPVTPSDTYSDPTTDPTSDPTNDPTSDSTTKPTPDSTSISGGGIAGIVIAATVVLILALCVLCIYMYKRHRIPATIKSRVPCLRQSVTKQDSTPTGTSPPPEGSTPDEENDTGVQLEDERTESSRMVTGRRTEKCIPHANVSRKGDKSLENKMPDEADSFSKRMPEAGSPQHEDSLRSPAVLRAEEGSGDSDLEDGNKKTLAKETMAVTPRGTAEGQMVLSPRSYVLNKNEQK